MSCKGTEPSSGSCAYTSTEACFQSKCRFGTVLEILLGITLKNKDLICSAAPQIHQGSAVTRRGWDWRGTKPNPSWNYAAITPAHLHGGAELLPSKTQKSSGGILVFVVKAEGINRYFCGGEVLSHTLGQLLKLQKACQYHLRFVYITCKKETNTGYVRNTGGNPELYKLGRRKKIVVEETVFQLLTRYLRQSYT